MNSNQEIGFVPTFIQCPKEYTTKGGWRKILDEKSFVKLVLEDHLTSTELRDRYQINQKTSSLSRRVYMEKYGARIIATKELNYRRGALMRDPATLNWGDKIIIPKEVLVGLIEEGLTEWSMAERLGVSPQVVGKNIRRYKLPQPRIKLQRMKREDSENLKKLEFLVPGIGDAAYRYVEDPLQFFHLLYLTYGQIYELLWFIKRIAGRHSQWLEARRIPKDHVCWNTNKAEIVLSMELLKNNIPHVRQFNFSKNYMADFYFPNTNLIAEINGSFHYPKTEVADKYIKVRDEERQAEMERTGYKCLILLGKEVERKPAEAVLNIQKALSKASSSPV
jgi:very-short-patch-repair endonuclease